MNRTRIILIAVASLLIGVAGSTWFWLELAKLFMNRSVVETTQSNIVTRVALLEDLRADRIPEATNYLELLLDSDLIAVGVLRQEGVALSSKTVHALAVERQARIASGYEPGGADVSRAIQDVLNSAKTEATNEAQPAQESPPR